MAYCRLCGHPTTSRIPASEDRPRSVCDSCGYIDYVNPINVVGTVPVWDEGGDDERILLCRRSIHPRLGYWTLPAGFLEVGESCEEGALRETWEEAGARVELAGLYSVLDVVHSAQVHLMYRATLLDLELNPGPETIENGLFRADQIPWESLSFHTVRRVLNHWVQDRGTGWTGVHTGTIHPRRG
ncbi:MAG: NUDIX hydrolase [Micrococcales bacterium]|nr:MAG: NUDIX hydrolase [Micrococcales bacterium]PIE25849.1 MAG: NUDIX hydrolase [Micrococcales bacterium]